MLFSRYADAYCEAVFGAFPFDEKFSFIKKAYEDAFKPELLPPSAENCISLFKQAHLTPLSASLYKLDVNFENRDDPTIFVFDPTQDG